MLNAVSTSITGADDAVEPVTSTLPVCPSRVHSGSAELSGAAVGQVSRAAVSVLVSVAVAPESELQPAKPSIIRAAPAAATPDEVMRFVFTVRRYPKLFFRHTTPSARRWGTRQCPTAGYGGHRTLAIRALGNRKGS